MRVRASAPPNDSRARQRHTGAVPARPRIERVLVGASIAVRVAGSLPPTLRPPRVRSQFDRVQGPQGAPLDQFVHRQGAHFLAQSPSSLALVSSATVYWII